MGLEHYLKQDMAVTTALYTEILKWKLKQAICNKCRSSLFKGVILLHDTTRLHYAAATIEAIRQLKF
jgi:RNase P subunit RPR2